MIASARRRHWGMTIGLMLLVPPIALVALSKRPPVPTLEALPPALEPARATSSGTWTAPLPFPDLAVQVRVSEDRWLALEATSPLVAPDPLVYWTAGQRSFRGGDGLPTDATFLGAWDGRDGVFRLPDSDGSKPEGTIWLYSLGHQRVLGARALPGVEPSRGAS